MPSLPGALLAMALLLGLLVPELSGRRAEAAVEEDPRPNILVIVTDDQAIKQMQRMAQTNQWFREEGRTFSKAFVSIPLCCPSRSSIFTGQYPHNHGVKINSDYRKLDPETTMQAYLQKAGYQTAIAGKYLNSSLDNPPYWDRWGTMRLPGSGYYSTEFNIDGTIKTIPGYSTDHLAHKASEYLFNFEDDDQLPWFLYVAPFAPHSPAKPAERHRALKMPPLELDPARLEADISDKPLSVQESQVPLERAQRFHRRQLRSLMAVDELVGQVRRTLEYLNEDQETLAIFTSDNGYLHADHGVLGKRYPYTKTIRVPLLMRWPGRIGEGTESPSFAMNIDIAPTVLEAAGITPQHTIDGRSLLTSPPRSHVFTEYFLDGTSGRVAPWASYRDNSVQYVEYYDGNGGIVFQEYYDLQADRYQLVNLLGDGDPLNDPDVSALQTQLTKDRSCAGPSCP